MAADDGVQNMHISASEVEFHEATPAQRVETWRLNGVSWAAPLPVDEYIRREQHLGETDFTANGLNRYWVLSKTADPTEVVASCETTRKTVHSGGFGGYRELRAYAIASVYTNPKYRRNGMAALLLTHLKAWMDGEGVSECSALYSDIGKVCFPALTSLSCLQSTVGILRETRLACVSISANRDFLRWRCICITFLYGGDEDPEERGSAAVMQPRHREFEKAVAKHGSCGISTHCL
jgi:GNAT superfamily N-acetyltransferase